MTASKSVDAILERADVFAESTPEVFQDVAAIGMEVMARP